ncbi:MAG: hypothetical protein HZC40_20060 [Chloroflexi bacterium]|nr:hypothetical protein [Chloroflexota bacterium]
MNTLNTSLRCLTHPATLTSIGILLLNDHLLKLANPSWLTGKLSDVTGLFFFPFLCAIVLGIGLERFRISTHRVGAIAFGLTAVCFTLIKTAPNANAFAKDTISFFLNVPTQIVLDPTDLIALPILVPAWFLWKKFPRAERHTSRKQWLEWFALGAGSLASLATTCAPIPNVWRIVTADSQIYAAYMPGSSTILESGDLGRTWAIRENPPIGVSQALQTYRNSNQPFCLPDNSAICFRGNGWEQTIEESNDGGKTWRVAWGVPAGRRIFMTRANFAPPCDKGLDLTLNDLAALSLNGEPVLIAAIRNEGIIVRMPGGIWERHAVMEAKPTPMLPDSPFMIPTIIALELALWLVIGIAIFIAASFYAWWILPSQSGAGSRSRSIGDITPGLFLIGAPIVFLIWFWFPTTSGNTALSDKLFGYLVMLFGTGAGFLAIISILLGLYIPWRRVSRTTTEAGAARQAIRYAFRATLRSIASGWIIWLFWAIGAIFLYETAMFFALMFAGFFLLGGLQRIHRIAIGARK